MADQTFEVRRALARTEAIIGPDGKRTGSRSVSDGTEIAEVLVMADLPKLARVLGQKAMRNKSGRSKALSGSIVVTVISRRNL